MVDPAEVENVIRDLIDEFLAEECESVIQINQGHCEEFAERVNESLDVELTIQSTADIVGGEFEERPEPWHVWVFDEETGLSYDAEHPSGVSAWSQLNMWSRTVTKQPPID